MKSLEKTIKILDYLSEAERTVGITELSLKLDLPKSTVHRILKDLLKYSIVEQEPETSHYKMGVRLLKYSNSLLKSIDLRQIAQPILKRVCHETGETTFLTIWHKHQGICIDSIFPSSKINTQLFVEIGKEMPFHCAASSKVILANRPLEEVKKIIKQAPLPQYTPRTITEPDQLMNHLLEIRKQGFAFCEEELEEGIKAIAAPIKDFQGKTIASITITGLVSRLSLDNREKLIGIVSAAAQEISKKLGCQGEKPLEEDKC